MVNKDKESGGFNKPVFVNSNKFYNKNENFSRNDIVENKQENKYDYKPRYNNNNNHNSNSGNNAFNERPKFFNPKPHDENKNTGLSAEDSTTHKYDKDTNLVYRNQNKTK